MNVIVLLTRLIKIIIMNLQVIVPLVNWGLGTAIIAVFGIVCVVLVILVVTMINSDKKKNE